MRRRTQSPFNRPAMSNTPLHGAVIQTTSHGVVSHGRCDALERNQLSAPLINALFLHSGPAAVFRRIALAVVTAFNGVLRAWLWPHVGVKGFKRVKPSLTHGNTSTTVVVKMCVIGSGAASDHVGPCSILDRVRHAMRDRSRSQLFDSQAAARVRARQIRNLNQLRLAAFALAEVFRSSRVRSVERQDGQPSVFVAD